MMPISSSFREGFFLQIRDRGGKRLAIWNRGDSMYLHIIWEEEHDSPTHDGIGRLF